MLKRNGESRNEIGIFQTGGASWNKTEHTGTGFYDLKQNGVSWNRVGPVGTERDNTD